MEMRTEKKYLIISLEGELDVENSSSIKDNIRNRISSEYPNLVIDLTKVNYVDSSGLGTLIALQKDARFNGGALSIVGASDQIRRVMNITNIDKLFELYDTLEEALK